MELDVRSAYLQNEKIVFFRFDHLVELTYVLVAQIFHSLDLQGNSSHIALQEKNEGVPA